MRSLKKRSRDPHEQQTGLEPTHPLLSHEAWLRVQSHHVTPESEEDFQTRSRRELITGARALSWMWDPARTRGHARPLIPGQRLKTNAALTGLGRILLLPLEKTKGEEPELVIGSRSLTGGRVLHLPHTPNPP